MLRPVLLLCWTLAIVSADTGVLPDSPDGHVAANTSGTTKLPVHINDAHVPQVEADIKNQPNVDLTESQTLTSTKATAPPSTETTTIQSIVKTTTPPSTKPTTPSSATPTTQSTTTAVPTTSTTPAPVTPLPPPSTGKWTVKDKNDTVCIIVQMAAQFNISYTDANNVTTSKAMDVPINSTELGECGKTEQNLTLSWQSQNNTNSQKNNFTLHFVKNETDKHYSLHHLEISLAPLEFPSNKTNKTVTVVHVAPQFSIGLSNSYRCLKEQSLNLTLPNNTAVVGHIKLSHLQFQAFRGDNTTVFGLAKDCSFDTPDIVPITVGCALAALVFIVLVAYLFGRRRSQTRGYLSM